MVPPAHLALASHDVPLRPSRPPPVEVRRTDHLLALQPAWDWLSEHSAPGNLYLTWEWAWAFAQVYGPPLLAEPYLLEVTHKGHLLGLAPLYRTTSVVGGRSVRRLHLSPAGPQWTYQRPTDLDLLAAPGAERAVGRAVAEHLSAHADDWEQLCLEGLRQDSLALEALSDGLLSEGHQVLAEPRLPCRHAELPPTWREYQGQLGAAYAQKVQRYERAFAAQQRSRLVVSAHSAGALEVLDDLDELVRLRRSGWCGDGPRGLLDARHVAFHQLLAPLLQRRGWLRLAFLLGPAGERLAGAYLASRGGQVMFYQQAWRSDLERLQPGLVLTAALVRHSIEEGAARFDLGCDTAYKAPWGHHLRGQQRLVVYNRSLSNGGEWAFDWTQSLAGLRQHQRAEEDKAS